jgi:hypothetical protein
MEDRFLDEYKYVKKVVKSCVTKDQRKNALRWAEDWAKRMQAIYPNSVNSWRDLYLSVIEQ